MKKETFECPGCFRTVSTASTWCSNCKTYHTGHYKLLNLPKEKFIWCVAKYEQEINSALIQVDGDVYSTRDYLDQIKCSCKKLGIKLEHALKELVEISIPLNDIYYSHDKRKIEDAQHQEYTFEEAVEGVASGRFTNWNQAFQTLVHFSGDTDKVEKYYQESEQAMVVSR